MSGLTRTEMIELLQKEVVPALGCTEPVCVALACADAAKAIGTIDDTVTSVYVEMNPGIYKNGKSVGIPNFPRVGLKYAAALGALLHNPECGLQLLSGITQKITEEAIKLAEDGCVNIVIAEKEEELYVKARVDCGEKYGVSVIRGSHSNIIYTESNGAVQKNVSKKAGKEDVLHEKLRSMSIKEMYDLVQNSSCDELAFMLDGAKMNGSVADFGVNAKDSIGISRSIASMMKKDVIGDTLLSRIMLKVAGGAEGRMSGCPYAVMSSAGSGNHGLEVTLPVAVSADYFGSSDEQLCRALALSHLLNIYIKLHTGRLSATCGCGVSAAASASAAMVYLMGGTVDQMGKAIINMAGNMTGMICDGGKVGCTLKLATASNAAVMSAYLAMDNVVVPADNGICADTAEKTIFNMGRISREMAQTDHEILQIMLEKDKEE